MWPLSTARGDMSCAEKKIDRKARAVCSEVKKKKRTNKNKCKPQNVKIVFFLLQDLKKSVPLKVEEKNIESS